ncbi:uncharacterized protein BDR25DRAFT_347377 [Lindgomyces ingoldianus]|uniref:Uncharacterized protein n=1 Tax=Lindgomyces ingoldianus TaxID=673940 RepID=A0ACB6Q8B5_9PLEO|nr:uncharacterized protein BDR25DRAFT_347377 [Lindgomyces ingoldianus]KAF2463159.1 hypothetical protein BDR25DRAFT_347377 [Lindgomyces ingoldianus]
MASYASQTKTMIQSISKTPSTTLGLSTKRDSESKPQLPTKRKRDQICGLGTFNKPFVIKPCPDAPYETPYTFKPVRIIGRSQLPLTFLDTTPNSASPARLFAAHIDVLEKHHDSQQQDNAPPKLLIARHEANRALYAVERVQSRVYSLCKLASWLKEKDVGDLWDPSNLMQYPRFPKVELSESSGTHWWQQAAVTAEPEEGPMKRTKIAMLRPKSVQIEPNSADINGAARECDRVDSVVPDQPEGVLVEAPSPQQQLETLVQQYLDALYMSKTSLAYFAKGPIARIRAAFSSSEEGAPPTYELVAFLKSMLISHKACEKKYREKLPDIIKSIPPGAFSDDDLLDGPAKPKKSRKKAKISRDGVYPQEGDMIKRWWISGMPGPEIYGEETIDQQIKRRVGDIRIRETLTQMILMLEIIALEALSTYKPQLEEETKEIQTQRETQEKPKKRKKKLDDINLRLDLLLDKLCIWQSVDQDELIDFDAKSSKKEGGGDRLQSFCIEVIIPFYMNRLPEQAMMINKKLGGPVHGSPPKRKAMKPPTASRKSGEPKEPDAKKSRRTLGRVASDRTSQAAQRRPTPSLSRSSTDSGLLNGIKREASEVPLSAIPFSRSPSAAVRQSMSQFKHLKGREIDLSTSAAAAAKLKQKRRVEEDLKEAITALKKPNRGLAAGSYADEVERRGFGVPTKSKKPANPVRKVTKDVQVSATPRTVRRTKDVDEWTPIRHHNPFGRDSKSDTPASSNFYVPSSAVRPTSSIVAGAVPRSITAQDMAASSITETPSKASTNKSMMSSGPARRMIFATPVNATDKNSASPSKISSPPTAIFATPTKENAVVADSPLPPHLPTFSTPVKSQEENIYDALGWDDDDFL